MDRGPDANPTFGTGRHFLESYYLKRNARVHPEGEFNNIDREWRKKYLHDQHLSANDGKLDLERNPDYRKARYNVFRRIFRWPMDQVEFNVLSKFMDWKKARGARVFLRGVGLTMGTIWFFSYYSMYRGNDWTDPVGWKVMYGKPIIFPTSSEFPDTPSYIRTHKSDYGKMGFIEEEHGKIQTSTPLQYS